MAVLKIDGTDMPSPSKLYVVLYDVKSKEDRNAAGQSVIDRTATKRRIECEWNYLSRANAATLLTAAGGGAVFFTVTYFDPLDNDFKTITCSIGEKVIGEYREDAGYPVWVGTKMTFFEQ